MDQLIVISEPWDFIFSDGDNRIKVEEVYKEKYFLIYKCLSVYENMSNFLLLQKRGSTDNYNIYQISDYTKIDFDSVKLSMIGKFD